MYTLGAYETPSEAIDALGSLFADPKKYAANYEQGTVLTNKINSTMSRFRELYWASAAAIGSIQKVNLTYGDSLMSLLNASSSRFNEIYDLYKKEIDATIVTIENVAEVLKRFETLLGEMTTFHQKVIEIASDPDKARTAMQDTSFVGQMENIWGSGFGMKGVFGGIFDLVKWGVIGLVVIVMFPTIRDMLKRKENT